MSILKVYLNWANSVLSEAGQYVEGVAAVQGGRVLCDLIDILHPQAKLVASVQQRSGPGDITAQTWVEAALDHMRGHGVKYTFTVQDILDGDIKSLLDVLWLTILNYSLHNIAQNAYQRSVGIGKKHLMEWCEVQLDTQFDPRNTFAFNLCQGDWFTKLLEKHVAVLSPVNQDRVRNLTSLLDQAEEKLSISRDILSGSDIVDGTVDEHTLMIYVALLRRRVGGEDSFRAYSRLRKPPGGMNMEVADAMRRSRSSSPASRYRSQSSEEERYSSDSELFRVEESRLKQLNNHSSFQHSASSKSSSSFRVNGTPSAFTSRKHGSAEELSDWVSSSSLMERKSESQSPDDMPTPLSSAGESMLKQTISQKVLEHMPTSENEEEKSASNKSRPSSTPMYNRNSSNGLHSSDNSQSHKSRDAVKIKRPKDYFLQWEDNLDRLSQGPSSSPHLLQSSRAHSDLDLLSDSGRSRSSSRSRSQESRYRLSEGFVTSSSLERERLAPEGFHRAKAHSQPESMKKYREGKTKNMRNGKTERPKSVGGQHEDLSLSDLNLESLSGTTINDLKSHPMFPNLKSLLSTLDPKELDILNKSDEPPDVLTLLEKIKQARLAVDNAMPKGSFRARDSREDTSVKTVTGEGSERVGSVSPQRPAEEMLASERHLRDLSQSPDRRRVSPAQVTERSSSTSQGYGIEDEHGLDESFSRLPRREAWERQRYKAKGTLIDASKIDSLAQARFIEVLCKEIEELKYRMDTMESSDDCSPMGRPPSRSGHSPVQTTGTKIEPLSQYSDIHEQNGRMVFESSRSRSLSPVYTRQRKSPEPLRRVPLSRSPDYSRSRSLSPKLEQQRELEKRLKNRISSERYGSPSSNVRRNSPSPVRNRSSPSPTYEFSPIRSGSRDRYSMHTSVGELIEDPLLDGEDQSRSISLGYSSPVRSVTQEIWGNKLNTIKGLEPQRQDRWKSLIAMRELSDEDVIELKQALASCIVENDILQAKVRNAKADVSEKLFKTNDVLDDCRRHLAKSQAENMELRSNLEHERQKTEGMESRMKSLESGIFAARAEVEQVKNKLADTTEDLNRARSELQPQEDLKKINQHLKINLSTVEGQNDSLTREVEDLQYSNVKAQTTIKELRMCLEEVREERSRLFEEINALHASNQKSKVADIMKHYTEKAEAEGAAGKPLSRPSSAGPTRTASGEHGRTNSPVGGIARRSRLDDYVSSRWSNSESTHRAHRRTSTWENELDSSPNKLNSSLNLSSTYDTISSKDTGYGTEDMTPTVPSSFREIYPHRKAQYHRDKMMNLDARASPIPFADYSDLQQFPTKLEYETKDDYLGKGGRDTLFQRQTRNTGYSEDTDQFESSQSYCSGRDVVETIVDTPSRYHSERVERLSHSYQEPPLQSHHHSQHSQDRLSNSYNTVSEYDKKTIQVSKRGILKNGREKSRSSLRERSCSPVLQRYGRSHSPPTRLSPGELGKQHKAVYGRSASAHRGGTHARELELNRSWDLKSGYSRAKSWYELQLSDNDERKERIAEISERVGQEPTILSDAQRRYADHLIEKYTGQRIPSMETF